MAELVKNSSRSTCKTLLDGQLDLWHTAFAFMKSMALKSAVDLRIADAIQSNGGAATLPQILTKMRIHPSKVSDLRRLMRVLATINVFSIVQQHQATSTEEEEEGDEEPVYTLTPASQLVIDSQLPFVNMLLDPAFVSPFFELASWFRREAPDPCVFKQAHGMAMWEMTKQDETLNALINGGLAADSRFILDVAIKLCPEVFKGGITSLVDVGGGLGAAAQTISKAFPQLKCSVLELEHVVAKAPRDTDVQYVVGDMFESIPPADAVLLKSVLHDWDHKDCVKILKNCRKAIPSRDAGGKVIILNMVIGAGPSSDMKNREMQAMFDLYIMFINGIERNELEWKNIFTEAGFSDYRIIPVIGVRSIIEVYP